MMELYIQIQQTNQAYQQFVSKWNSYGNNTGTGTQFSSHYATLRPATRALLEKAVNLIEGRLEFLEPFQNILSKVKAMNSQLEQQIESKRIYAHNTGTGIQFAAYINNILKVGQQLQNEANLLLKNWDIDLAQELHRHGVTDKTILIMLNHNIRRQSLRHITDADLSEIGVNVLGDKIILRNLINDLH